MATSHAAHSDIIAIQNISCQWTTNRAFDTVSQDKSNILILLGLKINTWSVIATNWSPSLRAQINPTPRENGYSKGSRIGERSVARSVPQNGDFIISLKIPT